MISRTVGEVRVYVIVPVVSREAELASKKETFPKVDILRYNIVRFKCICHISMAMSLNEVD